MVILPLTKSKSNSTTTPGASEQAPMSWVGFAAGGTLVAAGLLLLAGERKAGMVAAASGTALAMLDQPETLHSWWALLPGYIDQVQRVVGQVQEKVEEVSVRREALRQALAK
jgi:hypothetical protein